VYLVAYTDGVLRRHQRPPAIRLAPGEWVRWQINYRFNRPTRRYDPWSYRQDTLNIAYGPMVNDAFLDVPTYSVDERVQLF
jgi:hypothetical protein